LGTVPRISLTGPGAARFAACIAEVAVAAGLDVCALVITTEREVPEPDEVRRLTEVTRRAVHRLDPQLMTAAAVRRVTGRVAAGADLTLIVCCASLELETPDLETEAAACSAALRALASPICLCIDASRDRAIDHASRALSDDQSAPLTLIGDLRAANPSLPTDALAQILEHARRAPSLPAFDGLRSPRRARVGLLVDECFDLHDEESLAQFEEAGAELVVVSALEGSLPDDLDGLIVGDARVERYSAPLAARRGFRRDLRAAIEAGVPTLAAGGGYAYLTRGLRSLSGALHPLVGAIDAEAVVIDGALPRGLVEIETLVDTLIGPVGQRVRGHVERSWLVRGLPVEERGIYTTLAGPPDEGCGKQHLFATHFRPYWPSSPDAARAFVDRCALFATRAPMAPAEIR